MAELPGVQACLNGPGMRDADILAVISPPPSERNRNMILERGVTKPPNELVRLNTPIGAVLSSHTIRANHFRVDFHNVPGAFYQYSIGLHKIIQGKVDTEDVAQTEDFRNTVNVLRRLRKRHPEWERIGSRQVGFAYDGRKLLFTSAALPLPSRNARNEPFLEEWVGITDDAAGMLFTLSISYRPLQIF